MTDRQRTPTLPAARPRRPARVLSVLVLTAIVLGGAPLAADESAAGARGEVAPELFYLEREDGRLVPVPGFTYRDFLDLFRIREGLAGGLQPPAAVLEKVVVRIDARTLAETVPAAIECTVRQPHRGWAQVPLELGSLLLAGPPRHEGPGRMLLDARPGRGGYRAWFELPAADAPAADARHVVTLAGRLPADVAAGRASIGLELPTAVASLVEVRAVRAAVSVQPAVATERVSVAEAAGEATTTIAGLAGPVRVRVGADEPALAAGEDAAQAVVESLVTIDGRTARTTASIRLERLPAASSRLRIGLPSRTTLRAVRSPALLVARGGSDEKPFVDVTVERDAQDEAVVELDCERPVDPTGGTPFEALGFDVEGIEGWRQWGRTSVVVEGDWQVTWSDTPGLRRADPPPTARQPGFVAAFAHDAWPASLALRVRPRRSRVVVEPEYRYHVGRERIEFQARLRVAARGAPVGGITVNVDPAWVVEELGPATLVDGAAVVTEGGQVTVPFLQPLAGDAMVELRAARSIDRGAERVSWRLPSPRADLVGPALVVISADSDIELLPDAAGTGGLVRQTAAALPTGTDDRGALVYRLDGSDGTFAATRRSLPRRVEATVSAQVTIDESGIEVRESLRLGVLHVPLEFIELLVPGTVVASGTLEARQDGDLLDPVEVALPSAEGGEANRCLRAILPAPLLGSGELTLRYRLPAPQLPAESTVALELPLVLPVADGIGRQAVAIDAAGTLAVTVRGAVWRRDPGTQPSGWSAARPQQSIPLELSARRADATTATVVEAAWLQTRLAFDTREDLFTYAVRPGAPQLAFVVPATGAGDPAGRRCEVRLDGRQVPGAARADGRVIVELPDADGSRRRLLEVRLTEPRAAGWSRLAARFGLPSPLPLAAPVFGPGVVERRFYWQVHARADEHLVGAPARWTAQQAWRLGAWGWDQRSVVSARDLAAWVRETEGGIGPTGAEPPLAGRTLTFAGAGPPGAASPWLVPTWCLVGVVSGAALMAGLLLVHLAAARRAAVVLPTLAVCMLAAAAFPEAVPQVVQAAVPGVLLALVAWLLQGHTREARPAPGVGQAASASSLTRSVAPASGVLMVAGSGSTATGRSAE